MSSGRQWSGGPRCRQVQIRKSELPSPVKTVHDTHLRGQAHSPLNLSSVLPCKWKEPCLSSADRRTSRALEPEQVLTSSSRSLHIHQALQSVVGSMTMTEDFSFDGTSIVETHPSLTPCLHRCPACYGTKRQLRQLLASKT